MWFADIYIDLGWISERGGILGPPKFTLRGAKSTSLGIEIGFHFFGDSDSLRHVRVLLHTDDPDIADTCVNLNIQTWVTSIEASVMLETGQSFNVAHCPSFQIGSQMFPVVLTQDPERTAPMKLPRKHAVLDYFRMANGMAVLGSKISNHLFYLRRFIDGSLPLDVRWLNGYRLLEWHFVSKGAGLRKCPEWRAFVSRFENDLKPFLRPMQTSIGLLEEARFLAAHASLDERPEAERTRDPRNSMEKTSKTLEYMVTAVLNEHPSIVGGIVGFQDRFRASAGT
jgi:hypothetical protein